MADVERETDARLAAMQKRAEVAEALLAQIAEIASLESRWGAAEPPSATFARIVKIALGEDPA